jgi:hypothetical protein
VPYTWSFWAKSDSATDVNIRLDNNNGNFVQTNMALTTSWQRFSISLNSNATTILCFLGGGLSFTAGEVAYMAFAQLETGDIATDYIPTTTTAVSVGPVNNLPRLNYPINADGSVGCPSLLLEPQRTNGYRNGDLNGSVVGGALPTNWSVTTAAGLTTSVVGRGLDMGLPYVDIRFQGTLSATYTLSLGSNTEMSATGSTAYTQSFYAALQSGSVSNVILRQVLIQRNISGLYITEYSDTVTLSSTLSRKTATLTSSDAATAYLQPRFYITGTSQTIDIVVRFAAWQIEQGAYATSYIPTLAASVTRVADGTGTSDVFGTTYTLDSDFGLYWEGVINGNNVLPMFFSGGNYASGADFRSYMTYTGTVLRLFGVGEVVTAQRTIALSAGTYYKILVKRVGSTIKWYVNGTEYANASGIATTTVKIRSLFGSTFGIPNHESVAQALIFQTTLSDAQGIELTSL